MDVLANDDDPDRGDRIRVVSIGAPEHGQAHVVGAGAAVQYAPDPNYHGPDRFTYVVADAGGLADTATVEVTVTPVNDAPGAADDQATTREDEAIEIPVLDNDADLDGDRLRVRSVFVRRARYGRGRCGRNARHLRPGPELPRPGPLHLRRRRRGRPHRHRDRRSHRDPVNDAPEAADDQATTREDEAVEIPVLDNDADLDGDRLRVRSVSPADHGTAEVAGGGTHVTYVPDPNYHGLDRFTYVVADMDGLTDTATVEVTVVPVNDGPAAVGTIPHQLLDEGADGITVDLTPFFTDLDGDPLDFTAETSNATS